MISDDTRYRGSKMHQLYQQLKCALGGIDKNQTQLLAYCHRLLMCHRTLKEIQMALRKSPDAVNLIGKELMDAVDRHLTPNKEETNG